MIVESSFRVLLSRPLNEVKWVLSKNVQRTLIFLLVSMSLEALVHKVPHFKALIVDLEINGSSRKGRGSTFT